MITRKRIKNFNKILTCLLCKGYLIEATTINTCMHSFCRSCIIKHVKLYEKYFCPSCETEIRLSNLRPDFRLRSIVYKLVPGLFANEQQQAEEVNGRPKTFLNGSATKQERHQINEACSEDESLSKIYFYDQDEPISLSLEYHMESIFGNSSDNLNNIPQIRYLQAPAAFKVIHLKKFLSSKYDLSNLKKSMNIDIIYEGDIQNDDFSLMDIAYAYSWKREAPLKLFYRIYKSNKHSSYKLKLIEKALNHQPYVKLNSNFKEAKALTKSSKNHEIDDSHTRKVLEQPRHDLKIIIAKKSSSKSVGNNKIKLNKPNGNSKVLSDFERLRGDVDSVQQFSSASSSENFVSTSEMKTTLSKKTGTVSHHDLKLENKTSNTKKQHNNSNDSHDYYDSEREKERKSTKHGKSNEKVEKSKKSNLSLNIPKLKIELPSLKAKITVPKTPNDTYVITPKTPLSPLKKVRFDMSSSYDFHDGEAAEIDSVDQMEYAERIGLKPVERKVESIILHRKRKKSKHSKESEHSKRPKLHVSSSLDESLKLKLKIMGGKSSKSEATCNLRGKEEKQKKQNDDVVGLENYKYSVTEQKNAKSGGDQPPMVFIPKLVLQKTQSVVEDKKESCTGVDTTTTQRRNSFVVEQSNPTSSNANESIKLKVKSFDAIAASNLANQKLMKPPTAKMGSPQQSQISSTFSLSPIRPHSIPASLKLSPISQSPPSTSSRNDMKRSLSLGAEKSLQYPMEIQYSKIPPLIPTSSSFYGMSHSKMQSPHNSSKLPNINVKDPIKLFPNACSSVEILKIPQKYTPSGNIKLNRPMPTTIPLEKIRKSAQSSVSQKVLPKQNIVKPQGFVSPQCSNFNYSGIYQTPPLNHDISLERYTLELTQDIAKLDRSLSLEKNFEDWERRKLQEYSSRVNNYSKSLMSQQNLSVRNIPNPSAIMMSRNQSSGLKTGEKSPQKETVTSTNSEHSDIEEILSKSMIAKATEKSAAKSPGLRVNDKKSIEKVSEYLLITASKSKDIKHDDDNNNNNSTSNIDESSANGKNFNLMASKTEKFMNVNLPSVDVIFIDS